MADTIIRVIYEGVTYDLEIEDDIPLRLNISATEAGKLGEFFGVGSQTFSLPGNKVNNKFFNHAYDIGVEDVPAFYNTITGYVVYKGETVLRGQFYLLDVVTDKNGYVNYKCQITDDVIQLKDNLANQFIADADWSAYEHTISSASIISSWDGGLLSGSVYYPVAEYGDDPDAENVTFTKIGFSNGGTGQWFDKSTTPLLPQQLIPAIRVRDVLDVIINQVGFRATGSFFESQKFQDLYLLPKSQEGVGFKAQSGSTAIVYAGIDATNIPLFASTVSPVIVPFRSSTCQGCSDPLNAWNYTDSYYTMEDIGTYKFKVNHSSLNPFFFGGFTSADLKFDLMVGDHLFGGTVLDTQTISIASLDGQNVIVELGANHYNTVPGDEVWVQLSTTVTNGDVTFAVLGTIAGAFQCTEAPTSYEGATVDMSLQFPSDLRSIDVVNGLIQQFNLVLTPDYNQENTISVDTFDNWMLSGSNVDWTNKFESAERVSITHTIDEVEREIVYGNEKDIDRFSKVTIENEPGDQYGTLRLLADNNISQGTRKITTKFAPVILAAPFISGSVDEEGNPTYNVDLNSRFVVPHLYKFDNNRIKSYKFKPRVGYKLSNSVPSGSSFFFGEGGSATEITGTYTTLGNVNNLPVTASVTKNLHFNTTYGTFANPGLAFDDSRSNYDEYWKLLTDSLYWEGSRKVTLDVRFSPDEYKNIRLNDHIFIKNQQYRINKISGYNLNDTDVVTVELLKLYPSYFGPVTTVDCNFVVSGSYAENESCAIPITPTPTPTPVGFTPTPTPTVTPIPTPTPTPGAGPTINGWTFTAGKQSTSDNYGFHRGTTFGCPSTVGFGTTTYTTTSLPGTDCYALNCGVAPGNLVTKGYGINGQGTADGLVLTQFQYNSGLGGSWFIGLSTTSGNNPGNQNYTGTIVGSDGSSGTFQVSISAQGVGYIDDSCNGVVRTPESYGFPVVSGISGLGEGVFYTVELT